MSTPYIHWRIERDAQDLVWLVLDVADSRMNILSRSVLDEFSQILGLLDEDLPAGVAIASGKSKGFIAGADITEFTEIANAQQALEKIQTGHAVLAQLDGLLCPTIAVINGFCLGGGLELALACDYRIAQDDAGLRFSFPEVKLGIYPGYGGTVRTLRHVNPLAAMDLMLTGRSIDARRAKKIGLVDQIVPARQMENAARHILAHRPAKHKVAKHIALLNTRPARRLLAHQMRRQISKKALPEHYPAPYALVDHWCEHYGDEEQMLQHEASSVAELSMTATARNLVRTFMLSKKLKGFARHGSAPAAHVHVIGAGVMGGDIAAWCANKGLTVTLQDLREESLAKAKMRASQYFKRQLKNPRLVKRTLDRFIPDVRGHGLSKADIIIEAVFEDRDTKQDLLASIEPKVRKDALLATNTSSIEIEKLCDALTEPARLVGMHFFNPVTKMPLVEIVNGVQTRHEILQQAIDFSRQIDKLPLPVKSSPGFLVNRILTPYMVEAGLLREAGISAAEIDQAAIRFGMPMGPLELADTVGLDIGLHVAECLDAAYGFGVPESFRTMVQAGNLGRKSGQGFYKWKRGKKVSSRRRPSPKHTETIQNRLISRIVNEAVACLREEIVPDRDSLDAGIVFGTGFAPFRGGVMQYIDSRGAAEVLATLGSLQKQFGDRFQPDSGWHEVDMETVTPG
ncbi:MAG: 3-hydroxyacyl-CoA dehydrogenase NAD-binding domain-containing protein [Gammaproteobacteria bacterium]|nr:3-hydroxyacyl-CoA dehydrogenase NAD-binding domain-containing protein [Gammaproteobacteria bacterium]